jgi:hypothetical protein
MHRLPGDGIIFVLHSRMPGWSYEQLVHQMNFNPKPEVDEYCCIQLFEPYSKLYYIARRLKFHKVSSYYRLDENGVSYIALDEQSKGFKFTSNNQLSQLGLQVPTEIYNELYERRSKTTENELQIAQLSLRKAQEPRPNIPPKRTPDPNQTSHPAKAPETRTLAPNQRPASGQNQTQRTAAPTQSFQPGAPPSFQPSAHTQSFHQTAPPQIPQQAAPPQTFQQAAAPQQSFQQSAHPQSSQQTAPQQSFQQNQSSFLVHQPGMGPQSIPLVPNNSRQLYPNLGNVEGPPPGYVAPSFTYQNPVNTPRQTSPPHQPSAHQHFRFTSAPQKRVRSASTSPTYSTGNPSATSSASIGGGFRPPPSEAPHQSVKQLNQMYTQRFTNNFNCEPSRSQSYFQLNAR